MKKVLLIVLATVLVVPLMFFSRPAKSYLASYYSGDAISYQGKTYVASTNTGSLEIYQLNNDRLELIVDEKVLKPMYNTYDDFFDVKLSEESGHLYVYAVSHYTVFKFELVNNRLVLVKELKNTFWEWYNRVDKFADELILISAKGVRVLNNDLEFVKTYQFSNLAAPYNLSGEQANFLLNVNEASSVLEVFDKSKGQIVKNIPLDFRYSQGNRRATQDINGHIYVTDDLYTKKFSTTGQLLASFRHLDQQGFDVLVSPNSGQVYFSNGVGVVKLDSQLKLLDYAWATNFGGQGSWSMGIKLVQNNGDQLVVFNNTNITILDQELKPIATARMTKEAQEWPSENLFLNLDKYQVLAGSQVTVSGGGFLSNQTINLYLDNELLKESAQTDHRGRFTVKLNIPTGVSGVSDLKAVSADTGAHYSSSLTIK
ncbi:MAG: hypothetical protein ACOX0C_02610 [Patescibacteria group bacterium]|jgi:hypothetical protein